MSFYIGLVIWVLCLIFVRVSSSEKYILMFSIGKNKNTVDVHPAIRFICVIIAIPIVAILFEILGFLLGLIGSSILEPLVRLYHWFF